MKKTFDTQFIHDCCRRYTDFSQEDIQYLTNLARYLPLLGEASDCDVYIDIPNQYRPNEAIVLWESLRDNGLRKVGFLGEAIFRDNEPAVFRTLEIGCPTKDILARSQEKGGEVIWTRQSVVPIKRGGATLGALILDINTSQQEEDSREIEKLKDEQSTLTGILLSLLNSGTEENALLQIQEGILLFSARGQLCYANYGAKQIYRKIGYHSITGASFDDLMFLNKDFQQFLQEKVPITKEFQVDEYYFRMRAVYVEHAEVSVIVIFEDISEQKNKSIELAAYLQSYRETQHRVKNNLQTVSSLLRLQSRSCTSEEAKSALADSISRIESIAATYEVLQTGRTEEQSSVSLRSILEHIKENILHLYDGFYQVQINLFCSEIDLDSITASTVALIINELLQNAFKHAFSQEKRGTITISAASEGGTCRISVMDDGAGFQSDVASTFGKGLGSSIIISFVEEKLGGKWKIRSGPNGTQFTFVFAPKGRE